MTISLDELRERLELRKRKKADALELSDVFELFEFVLRVSALLFSAVSLAMLFLTSVMQALGVEGGSSGTWRN
jgi:hypothetical protein